MSSPKTAICGGGIRGLSAAITGHEVAVFEKTRAFNKAGADVNLTPNAIFAVDPTFRISCDGEIGEKTSRPPMNGSNADRVYGYDVRNAP